MGRRFNQEVRKFFNWLNWPRLEREVPSNPYLGMESQKTKLTGGYLIFTVLMPLSGRIGYSGGMGSIMYFFKSGMMFSSFTFKRDIFVHYFFWLERGGLWNILIEPLLKQAYLHVIFVEKKNSKIFFSFSDFLSFQRHVKIKADSNKRPGTLRHWHYESYQDRVKMLC